MTTKHTPGPWMIDSSVATHIIGANRRPVATSGGYSSNAIPDNGRAENEANARLIAAAPTLLAVLDAMLNCPIRPVGDYQYAKAVSARKMAAAAIAQAEKGDA